MNTTRMTLAHSEYFYQIQTENQFFEKFGTTEQHL